MATARSFLEAGIVSPTKVEVVYNGVDLERFPHSRAHEGNAIICVGSLAPHKGQDVLVRAMEKVREKVGEASLTLVGDGTQRAKLEDIVEELGLGGAVRFAGRIDDVHEYLRNSRLFVLPSVEREGLGIALLEAMATGLAAVATDCGGVGEIIEHEVNGLLVPQGEHLPLADAIVRLLKNERLASTLAAMGRKTVEERFDIETTCDKLVKIYEEVAGA